MKISSFLLISFLTLNVCFAQKEINHKEIKEDLYQMLNNISEYYAYQKDKDVDLNCLKKFYENEIPNIKTEEESVLFFEYLLDEFYDSHLTLNTNRNSSFRLYSPIYATLKNGKLIITSVWQTQLKNLDQNILGAELLKINDIDIDTAIENFPTHCNNKNAKETREWIVNKLLSGRRNQPRLLSLKLTTNKVIKFNLDLLKLKQNETLLTSTIENNIGIININNSLGENGLLAEFDKSLTELMDTKGLIIDLRNTVGGGNSYVARGIMGRFLKEQKPYQKHQILERYDGKEVVERSWIEYVSPRGEIYKKPVVILVGRWTGSMGEGLAIGFEGMQRAEIFGSEMERLAGEMNEFQFKHRNYSYRISFAKLFHVDGTPREKYIPTNYVAQTTIENDETLESGVQLINKMSE